MNGWHGENDGDKGGYPLTTSNMEEQTRVVKLG